MKYTTYEEFDKAKSACHKCEIGIIYGKIVLSQGCKTKPKVVFIGEAPGADEVIDGKPFVGKAGKLLRSTMNGHGFRQGNSLITNTIPCRPYLNKFPAEEKVVKSCVDKWLKEEMALLNPSYIVLVGATPLRYTLGLKGITSLRGKWLEWEINGKKIPCMPTYHPSYVLRKMYMEDGKQIQSDFSNDIKEVAKKAGIIKGNE